MNWPAATGSLTPFLSNQPTFAPHDFIHARPWELYDLDNQVIPVWIADLPPSKDHAVTTADVDFRMLLRRTSRTFELSIPLLPEPHCRRLTLAYLLFRVADTLEDAEGKPREERLAALTELDDLLSEPNADFAEALSQKWVRWKPSENEGYLELLEAFPALLEAIMSLDDSCRGIVIHHTRRTIAGMSQFVAQSGDDGSLRLASMQALCDYCYAVAGIVGEMITDLFLDHSSNLASVAETLREHAAAFGEGLQLVNILKDAADDARFGRCYLPSGVNRDDVFHQAHADLDQAEVWIAALETAGADAGLIAFGKLPVRLARVTLATVQERGPGAKISRAEVARIVQEIDPEFKLLGSIPEGLADQYLT